MQTLSADIRADIAALCNFASSELIYSPRWQESTYTMVCDKEYVAVKARELGDVLGRVRAFLRETED